MKERISGIYILHNISNNKVYVGSSRNCNKRLSEHFYKLRKGIHDNRFLAEEFNENNFECFIVDRCPVSHLIEQEQYWMNILKSWDRRFGYNIYSNAIGPIGHQLSESTKTKMSKVRRGRRRTPESLEKASKSVRNFWKSHPEKIEELRLKTSKSTPIVQLSLDNIFIKEHISMAAAARELNTVHASSIRQVCKGRQKSACGFKWMYKNEYETTKTV